MVVQMRRVRVYIYILGPRFTQDLCTLFGKNPVILTERKKARSLARLLISEACSACVASCSFLGDSPKRDVRLR